MEECEEQNLIFVHFGMMYALKAEWRNVDSKVLCSFQLFCVLKWTNVKSDILALFFSVGL